MASHCSGDCCSSSRERHRNAVRLSLVLASVSPTPPTGRCGSTSRTRHGYREWGLGVRGWGLGSGDELPGFSAELRSLVLVAHTLEATDQRRRSKECLIAGSGSVVLQFLQAIRWKRADVGYNLPTIVHDLPQCLMPLRPQHDVTGKSDRIARCPGKSL